MEDFKKPELMYDLGMLKKNTGSTPKHMGVFCCSCGKWFKSSLYDVKSGKSTSCGCRKLRILNTKNLTHGKSKSKIYIKWRSMIQRCTNPNHTKYRFYGGAGITVCDGWKNSFVVFQEWAMQNGYSDNLEPDRIDTTGNYSPENVRWITHKENCENRKQPNNKTGFKGVYQHGDWFVAGISINGKNKQIGRYKAPIDAALAYNQYIIENKLPNKLGIIP